MKYIRFLATGIFFGIVMTKSQVISWYRVYEMFRFDSFHIFGIIGTAVSLGVLGVALIKRFKLKSYDGLLISFAPKDRSIARYLVGGVIFGLGWSMTVACPGPIYTLLGNGFSVILVVFASALLGTFTYGMVRDKLPH
ncbi:MAG: DUF6691 family protein [Candidatus Cyclobacteriaceae bacterium M3_2C_046]